MPHPWKRSRLDWRELGALNWTLFFAWEARESKQGMQRAKHTMRTLTKQHAEEEGALGSCRLCTPIEVLVYFSFTRKKTDKLSISFLKLNSNKYPGS